MSEAMLFWGIGLMGVALLLFLVELIVPSGGLIGAVSIVSALAGVVAFWQISTMWGIVSLLTVLIFIPVGVYFALNVMPHTPFGRGLILGGDDASEDDQERLIAEAQRREREQALVGATGVAVQDLRPVGAAKIEGQKVEVLAVGGRIDQGARIRVVAVEGNQIKVRVVD